MHNTMQHQQACLKHKKDQNILVVKQARYICEDCAIFQHRYRQEVLVQKQAVGKQVSRIAMECSELMKQQKSLVQTGLEKMNSLIRSIQHFQVSVINQINNQFAEVKSKVSENYMRAIKSLQDENKVNGKKKLQELKKQISSEQNIRKHYFYQTQLQLYKRSMSQEMENVFNVFQLMKHQVEHNVSVKLNIISAFESVINIKPKQNCNKIEQIFTTDEDLLDFSEFYIPLAQYQFTKQQKIIEPTIPHLESVFQSKKNHVERRRTAACLEDSICSVESLAQSVQSQVFTVDVSEIIHHPNPSLLSDRSISCASTVSKYQQASQIISTFRQPSKKSTIQITSAQQLNSKLLSIPPTIKSIRFINSPITTQQFFQVLKQKISRSFINSLQIVNCPKLTDKVLMDIKSHKCKGLKRVEIRDCKEFNWNDKKVKEMLKKLESEGVKVVY